MTLTDAFARPDDDARLDVLRADLARRADQEGLLDLAYRTVATPVGELLLVATPRGLVRIAYQVQDFDTVLTDLASAVSPRILHAPARLKEPARELQEYFAGRRRRFEIALDLQLTHGFRRQVVQQLPHIDYGRTASYAEVARRAGSAKAVRAVGSACATNPLPVVVPCHRVVRSDGALGGYVGGSAAKRALLELEAA